MRFKVLHAAAEHGPGGIIEGQVKMGMGRVFGLEPLDNETLDYKRTIFPLQPDFLDDDDGGICAVQFDMSHVGRCPEGRGATGQCGGCEDY